MPRRAWAAGLLLAVAAACPFVPAHADEIHWSGFYKCKSQPGLFSSSREVVSAVVELVEDEEGGLRGTRDGGDYMEKFNGSVAPDGEVTLVGDGFWAGATGRTTTLQAGGRIHGRELVVAGVRVERQMAAERDRVNCELSLLNLSVSATPRYRAGPEDASHAASRVSSRVSNGATLEEALALEAGQGKKPDEARNAEARTSEGAPPAASPQGTAAVPLTEAQPGGSAVPSRPGSGPVVQVLATAPDPATPAAPDPAPPGRQAETRPAEPRAPLAHRRALVVGNDAYRFVPRLAKAGADARAMGEALRQAGFDVTLRLDLDERRFKEVLRQFRLSVEGGDEVVLYFAGHGVQLGGVNYLLPTDIRGDEEEQVKDESLPLQKLLDDMADRRAGFLLAIVDACRDNPFKAAGRSIGGRGLAPTTAVSGQMVIYSAGSGQQALDSLGPADRSPNGVFARVFLEEMKKPDLTVDRVLRNVRSRVVEIARGVGHEQVPALYDQALGDYYLLRTAKRTP